MWIQVNDSSSTWENELLRRNDRLTWWGAIQYGKLALAYWFLHSVKCDAITLWQQRTIVITPFKNLLLGIRFLREIIIPIKKKR